MIIEIIMMMNNNRDVNYLHSLKEFYDTLQSQKYSILGQISCQNCHNPNNTGADA